MEDWIQQLERLAKLRDDGILTDEEFAAQKQKVLSERGEPGNSETIKQASPQEQSSRWITITPRQILNLSWVFLAYGIIGFTSIFFEWVGDGWISFQASNLDSGVARAVIFYIFFPIIAIAAFIASNRNPDRQKKTVAFVIPILGLSIGELYENFNLFIITPLREQEESFKSILFDYLGPGAWLQLTACLIAVILFVNLIRWFRDLTRETQNYSDWPILIAALLICAGTLYPSLKPNAYSWDFTPFKDVFQGDGGLLAVTLVFCGVWIGISLLVISIKDRNVRNWGIAGMLFLYTSEIIGLIAFNADTEYSLVWSFGGTLGVFGLICVVLVLLSRGLNKVIDLSSFTADE